MPAIQINITVPPAFEDEVREALQFHQGLDSPANNGQIQQWLRRPLRDIVFKYRASQRADIDRTDPTSD